MDSVTQIALGASVAGLIAPRGFRRRALVWGAAVGTLPDLDVLVPLGDPVSDFTYHRGVSHSLFFMTLATPLIAALGWRVHRDSMRFVRWLWMIWMVLITHALLDCFTVYGTQVGLPFTDYPVGLATIFIIDPLYTVPLLIGMTVAAFRGAKGNRPFALCCGVVFSSAYLAWTVGAKVWLSGRVSEELAARNVPTETLLIMPTAFNSVAWRVLAMGTEQYYESFVSVFNPAELSPPAGYPQQSVPAQVAEVGAVQRLAWFSKGFSRYEQRGDEFVVTDLRMGSEPWYVFSFAVARQQGGGWQAIHPRQLDPGPVPDDSLAQLWRLIKGLPLTLPDPGAP